MSVYRTLPGPKQYVNVHPTQWLPGALSAMMPLFAVDQETANGKLFLRADDPNIFGISYVGIQQVPVVEKNFIQKVGNKGFNFYSASWSIPTFPARDINKRIDITSVDNSVYNYITALYKLVGQDPIHLTDWKLEKEGAVKIYQIIRGSRYTIQNGVSYFGGVPETDTDVGGVSNTSHIQSPLITDDFTYNGALIDTIQMPYNTFCAVDTPIVISAIDSLHPNNPRIYFTLSNPTTVSNTNN